MVVVVVVVAVVVVRKYKIALLYGIIMCNKYKYPKVSLRAYK